jgi:hypothetical protein
LIYNTSLEEYSSGAIFLTYFVNDFTKIIHFSPVHIGEKYEMYSVLQMTKNYRYNLKQSAILMMEVTNIIHSTHLNKITH